MIVALTFDALTLQVFDRPTVSALAEFVSSKLLTAADTRKDLSHAAQHAATVAGVTPDVAAVGGLAAPVTVTPATSVAIISSACRLPAAFIPGSSYNAVDTVTCIPFNRWDTSSATEKAGEAQASFGSFVPHVAAFDAAAFGMSKAEALLQDPQQRMLMEVSWEALGHTAAAGLSADAASYRSSCGVFVGVSSRDYFTLGKAYAQVRGRPL